MNAYQRQQWNDNAPRRDAIAELVSVGFSLMQIAVELDIPHMRVKKLWRQIREELGPQAV